MNRLKSILKSVGLGLLKATPIIGNVTEEVTKGIEQNQEHSPKGKIDYARLFGYLIMSIIVISVIFGKLDLETAERLIKKLNLFSFFS